LAGANGRGITTGTAPDDDHVVCHGVILYFNREINIPGTFVAQVRKY
jgi:hypothetical protein